MNIQSKPISHHVTNQYGNLTGHRKMSQTNRIATDEAGTASVGHNGGTNMMRGSVSACYIVLSFRLSIG